MKFQQLLSRVGVPLLGIILFAIAYRFYGWKGIAVAASLMVMWALMHFNRFMRVLERAAKRPVGYVDSAVMLNAKLKSGVSLLHVLAMTRRWANSSLFRTGSRRCTAGPMARSRM